MNIGPSSSHYASTGTCVSLTTRVRTQCLWNEIFLSYVSDPIYIFLLFSFPFSHFCGGNDILFRNRQNWMKKDITSELLARKVKRVHCENETTFKILQFWRYGSFCRTVQVNSSNDFVNYALFFTVEKNKDYSERDQVAIKINRDSNIFDAVRACLFTYQLVMFRSIDICFTCYIRPNFVLWKYATTVIINTTSKSSVKHIFCTVTLLCSITSSCIDASYFYASCHLHWTHVDIMYWPIVMITSLLEWVNK